MKKKSMREREELKGRKFDFYSSLTKRLSSITLGQPFSLKF